MMTWWRQLQNEEGQALALFVIGIAVFCGLVGLAVDVGQLVYTRTELQKTADAAALAGAQDLLASSTTATAKANEYVNLNTSGATAAIVISDTKNPHDTIQVTASKPVHYTFLRALGLTGATVSAKAKVKVGVYDGGSGIVPWGIVASSNKDFLGNSCFVGWDSPGMPKFKTGTACTLKFGAGSSSGGDFGPLALDGTGGSEYRDDISHGSNKSFHVGDKLEVQTGNMQGPTGQGTNDRLALPLPATCQTNVKSQIVKIAADGSASIVPGCEHHPRIMIIPVVDKIANPAQSTLLGFAYVYLNGIVGSGGGSTVSVDFVNFVTEIPGGDYNGTGSGSTMIDLIE